MSKKVFHIILIWNIWLTGLLIAQDISIRAYVSKNRVGLNEQFQYSVEVSGKSTSLPNPKFPAFSDFYVLSGPNSSTSIQWVNGAMSSSKTASFYLQPRKQGKFIIGKASVTYKGKTLQSRPITITVVKGNASAAAPPSKSKKAPVRRSDADIAGSSLYLKAHVSRRNVYIGQQILVTYKLYFRVQVRGYNWDKTPSNAGFWTEDFQLPSQPVIEQEIVNGINYNVAVLKKEALFPTQTGTLTIEPLRIKVEAAIRSRRRGRSLFDDFFNDPFFSQTVQKSLASNPVKITVLPLPEKGKPADFTGAVGQFRLNLSTDKQQARVNEAIALRMTLQGKGNIKLADLPKVPIPPDLEQYEPKVSTKLNKQHNSISGKKTAEYILVPRVEGQFQIKPVHFSFFDPLQKKYKTITTRPIMLTILKGKQQPGLAGAAGNNYSREEVTLLGQDIRFIKEFSVFHPIGYRPYWTLSFWLFVLGVLILFILFELYDEHQARLLGDERLARRHKAGKLAAKQLARAKALLLSEDQTGFYKAISTALQGFVRDKLNIELTEFNNSNIKSKFNERGIPEEETGAYLSVLEESDFRQFANIKSERSERQAFYEKAKMILTRLEKWI